MQFAQYTLPDFCRFSSGISPEIRFANVCVCIFFQKYLIFLISGVKNAHKFRHFRQSPLFPVFSPFSGRLPGFFRKVRAACSARGSRPCSCVRSTVPFNREISTSVTLGTRLGRTAGRGRGRCLFPSGTLRFMSNNFRRRFIICKVPKRVGFFWGNISRST